MPPWIDPPPPSPVIVEVPGDDDATALGVMHLASWQETYPSAAHGIDARWISDHVGFMTSPAADDFRRRVFAAQREDPASTFCRLARHGDDVVGFVHACLTPATGRSSAATGPSGEDAKLEALYLLETHQGTGLADQMMLAALGWLGGRAVRLEVASYNARVLRFYARHGFQRTGEQGVFRGRVPTLQMRRRADR